MRGKRRLREPRPAAHRNIPAYAGKTNVLSNGVVMMSEHPRVCGENAAKILMAAGEKGTSPRMRGKLHGRPTSPHDVRNIPAYAGKTLALAMVGSAMAEHPRVCGENLAWLAISWAISGTSPRMRGKRKQSCGLRPPAPEHPRVCGENSIWRSSAIALAGTSPRMRGKLCWRLIGE